MPSDQAVAREARLVKNLANWLRSQGKPCTVLGWPDRDPGSWPGGLTVEAVLVVGPDGAQAEWAVDVMTVPIPQSTAAGMAEARQQLLVPAAQLAESAHRAVTISIRIPDGAGRKAYYQEVLARVEEALRTGSDYYDASGKDQATQVLLSDGEFIGDPSGPHGAVRVHMAPFTGGTPDLLAELQSTLVAPLDKKLGNQLKRAKDHGYHTLLALDQVGNESLPAGTTWLPSASAVATTVAQRVSAHPGILDAAVLAQPGDLLVQVFGNTI
jgi:hypothetical protein